jgi:hypothetical protein
MARHCGIHASVLSLVFQKKRELTLEQAAALADYFGLNEAESQYLLLLVQLERAGNEPLRKLLRKQKETLLASRNQVVKRVKSSRKLTEEEKAIYYSSWLYSAVRILSALPGLSAKEPLRKKLGLGREPFQQIVDFLVRQGLCAEEGGRLRPLAHSTHLDGASPLVSRHHGNWRVKAMEKHPSLDQERELAFTSPMALSRADALKVRSLLLDAIEGVCRIADPSPSETAYFLNLDWLEI